MMKSKAIRKASPPVAVYQEHINLYGHGTAMWSTATFDNTANVGDVGVVSVTGVFCSFFNITLPRDHPFNHIVGVPDDFEVLELSPSDIQQTNDYLEQGAIIASPGVVEMTSDQSGENVMRLGTDEDRPFVCTADSGAVLALPQGAGRIELSEDARRRICEYCVKHAKSWRRHLDAKSSDDTLPPCAVQDLLVVTGVVKASQWTMGSYTKNAPPWPLPKHPWMRSIVPCYARPQPEAWQDAYPRVWSGHVQPHDRDRCMFVSGYRCKLSWRVRDVHLPQLDSGPSIVEYWMGLGGLKSKYHDAVEEILNYILNHSSAKMAIASDRDLRAITHCSPEPLSPDSFPIYLKKLRPKIIVTKEKVGSLDSDALNDSAEKLSWACGSAEELKQ